MKPANFFSIHSVIRLLVLISLGGTFAISTSASGMALLDMDGKIHGFDEKEYNILVGSTLYEIKSTGLSPEALGDLRKKHTGDMVRLTVPTDAILSYRTLTTAAFSAGSAPKWKSKKSSAEPTQKQ